MSLEKIREYSRETLKGSDAELAKKKRRRLKQHLSPKVGLADLQREITVPPVG